MVKSKKIVSAGLALAVVLSAMLGGCGTKDQTANSSSSTATVTTTATTEQKVDGLDISKKEKIVIYKGGTPNTDEKLVLDELFKKTEKVINAQVDIISVAWGDYVNKLNLMAAGGDQVDAFSIWKGGESQFINKPGFIAPVDELVQKYGTNLSKVIPNDVWNYLKFNGKAMGIPQMFQQKRNVSVIRMELAEKVGVKTVPKNMAELESTLEKIHEKYPELVVYTSGDYKAINLLEYIGFVPQVLRQGDMYYYYDDAEKTFKTLYDHPTCIEARESVQRWYKKGLIDKDVIMRKSNQANDMTKAGKLVLFGAPWVDQAAAIQTSVPDIKYGVIDFSLANNEKPISFQNLILLTESSKVKERVVKLFDWVWSSQDNYNSVIFGIEGTHFVKTSDGGVKAPDGMDPAKNPFPSSTFDTVFQCSTYFKLPANLPTISMEGLKTQWDYKNYQPMNPYAAFSPDMKKFSDVIPTQSRLIEEYLQSTLLGTKPVKAATDELIKKWYDSCKGKEQIDELNKQMADWLKTQGK